MNQSTNTHEPPPELRVGFIGLGTMGFRMASRIGAAGVELTVRDLDPAAETGLAAAMPSVRPGTRNEIAGCDVIILMLPDSGTVEAEVLGTKGLFATIRPGAVLVDMGSSDPMRTRQLAKAAEAAGVHLLDAPVSGETRGADSGDLAIMVGGDAAALERVRPVLDLVGSRITHVGTSGAGHAVKALNNLLSASAWSQPQRCCSPSPSLA